MRLVSVGWFICLGVFFLSGCGIFEDMPEEEDEAQPVEVPAEIEDIEMACLEVMQEADLTVLLEEGEEAEQLEEEEATEEDEEEGEGDGEEEEEDSDNDDHEEGSEGEGEGEENGLEASAAGEGEEGFDETIWSEVIDREMEQDDEDEGGEDDIPAQWEAAWDNIESNVTSIHEFWDVLKPQLQDQEISPGAASAFEEELDELTSLAAGNNRLEVMASANELTGPLAEFMVPYGKEAVPEVMEMKYYLRRVVLEAAHAEYEEAQDSFEIMEAKQARVANALQDDNPEKVSELKTSLAEFKRVLEQEEEHEILKIKASLAMKNLEETLEELEEIEEGENEEENEENKDEEDDDEENDEDENDEEEENNEDMI